MGWDVIDATAGRPASKQRVIRCAQRVGPILGLNQQFRVTRTTDLPLGHAPHTPVTVSLVEPGVVRCTCKVFNDHHILCRHVYCVVLAVQDETNEDSAGDARSIANLFKDLCSKTAWAGQQYAAETSRGLSTAAEGRLGRGARRLPPAAGVAPPRDPLFASTIPPIAASVPV